MENKKVSIIMGIYNCENTLGESIESIINQTYLNWELIMCDDGSKDNTYCIAEKYKNLYPEKIKLLKNNKNMKLAPTLNNCLKYAGGDYIARMDADDIALQQRLEIQIEFLEKHLEYDLVGGALIPFDENGEKGIRRFEMIPDERYFIKNTPFAHPTIMARAKVYKVLKGYSTDRNITRCEDIDLWFRFFKEGFKGYNLPIPLLKYREYLSDYQKRKVEYGYDTAKVCYRGYKMLNYPKIYYIFLLKPIICALIPNIIIKTYHNKKDLNSN